MTQDIVSWNYLNGRPGRRERTLTKEEIEILYGSRESGIVRIVHKRGRLWRRYWLSRETYGKSWWAYVEG